MNIHKFIHFAHVAFGVASTIIFFLMTIGMAMSKIIHF